MSKKKFNITEEVVIDKEKTTVPEEPILVKAEETKTTVSEEPTKKQTKKETHKVYSFWANKEQIEVWKCYQEANNELEKAEDLGLKAIQEYINNHALTGTEAEIYELKLKSKGLENSIYR